MQDTDFLEMKKVDFLQVSQLFSNLAVVIGIVFLAVEVREAGNATQVATENALVQGYNALNLTLAADAALSRIFAIGLEDPSKLDAVEAAQFSNLMRAIMNQHVQMYRLYTLGLVSKEAWSYSAQQAAQIRSTAGGILFRQTNDYEDSSFLQAIGPFMGQPMKSSFSLDRSPEDF